MKLKGKVLERLPPAQIVRLEATLKRMERVRREDDMFLRDVIKEKLEWAKAERQKGFDTIKMFKTKSDDVHRQILKLEGIILVLIELVDIEKCDVEKEAKARATEKAKEIEEAKGADK